MAWGLEEVHQHFSRDYQNILDVLGVQNLVSYLQFLLGALSRSSVRLCVHLHSRVNVRAPVYGGQRSMLGF